MKHEFILWPSGHVNDAAAADDDGGGGDDVAADADVVDDEDGDDGGEGQLKIKRGPTLTSTNILLLIQESGRIIKTF